jgi:hypothetical protein
MRLPITLFSFSLLTLTGMGALTAATVEPPKDAGSSDAIVPFKTAKLVIFEDFESTAPGQIPKGFTKKGACEVVAEGAHSGMNCLKLAAAPKGMRGLEKTGPEIAALGGTHWGRMFFKVQLPASVPVGNGAHTTMVAGAAQSPSEKDPIEVRLMGLSVGKENFHWLYNVQPRKGRKEFGANSRATQKFTDQWTLAEWYVDNLTQTYRFFINGQELTDLSFHKGEGKYEGAEIPAVFESMTFGWCNYQPVQDPGFVVWIDDLAVGKDRIGDQTQESAAKPGKKK